jgi:hypothetical protein
MNGFVPLYISIWDGGLWRDRFFAMLKLDGLWMG